MGSVLTLRNYSVVYSVVNGQTPRLKAHIVIATVPY